MIRIQFLLFSCETLIWLCLGCRLDARFLQRTCLPCRRRHPLQRIVSHRNLPHIQFFLPIFCRVSNDHFLSLLSIESLQFLRPWSRNLASDMGVLIKASSKMLGRVTILLSYKNFWRARGQNNRLVSFQALSLEGKYSTSNVLGYVTYYSSAYFRNAHFFIQRVIWRNVANSLQLFC